MQLVTDFGDTTMNADVGDTAMKITLAPQYRRWMFLLLPATLGVGTAALWLRSLRWPCSIDEQGLTLRSRRKVRWQAIRQITVVCNYLDGRVARIDIRRRGGTCRVPVNALRDGQRVATAILTMFKQSRRTCARALPVTGAPTLLPELPAAQRIPRERNFPIRLEERW
jgi:hypothetical protein